MTIRWFVGLGTGSEPEQQDRQQAIVDEFNETHDDIQLEIEIVDNAVAAETLATQIAGGNAPDIIGPVGIRGSNSFDGQYPRPRAPRRGERLRPVGLRGGAGRVLAGRRRCADRACPSACTRRSSGTTPRSSTRPASSTRPRSSVEPYADGDPWDYDKVQELARVLTVDANGNDATNPAFDPNSVVQWGFHNQFNDDARAQGTMFGPGSFVADDGSAQIPEQWLAELAVVPRHDLGRPLGAQPVPARQRHAEPGQRVQHRQRGHGLHAPLVHLLRRRRRRRRTGRLRHRRGPRVQRSGHVEAPRRHLPHPGGDPRIPRRPSR